MKHALIVIASLPLLTGCGVTLKTVTLHPSQLNYSWRRQHYEGYWCNFDVSAHGTGPETAGPGEIFSGFEDWFDGGSGLAPCKEKLELLYRGWVTFDLSPFDNIVAATLNFNVARSLSTNGGVVDEHPPACNATTLGMSTGTRDDGNGPYFWDFDNDAAVPSAPSPDCVPNFQTGFGYSLGVSTQARAWANKSHPNFGFILAGPKLDFPSGDPSDVPEDNIGHVSWYNNFQLQVTYNPALNTRAPQ